jgi:hypothetical protein
MRSIRNHFGKSFGLLSSFRQLSGSLTNLWGGWFFAGIWKAAGERHPGAMNIVHSIEISSDRFSVSEHLKKILMNTAREMGWI